MDKQWTNAVCGQRKKPVNCVFTDSALVEVTGLEPTASTTPNVLDIYLQINRLFRRFFLSTNTLHLLYKC